MIWKYFEIQSTTKCLYSIFTSFHIINHWRMRFMKKCHILPKMNFNNIIDKQKTSLWKKYAFKSICSHKIMRTNYYLGLIWIYLKWISSLQFIEKLYSDLDVFALCFKQRIEIDIESDFSIFEDQNYDKRKNHIVSQIPVLKVEFNI